MRNRRDIGGVDGEVCGGGLIYRARFSMPKLLSVEVLAWLFRRRTGYLSQKRKEGGKKEQLQVVSTAIRRKRSGT